MPITVLGKTTYSRIFGQHKLALMGGKEKRTQSWGGREDRGGKKKRSRKQGLGQRDGRKKKREREKDGRDLGTNVPASSSSSYKTKSPYVAHPVCP